MMELMDVPQQSFFFPIANAVVIPGSGFGNVTAL
jgi:hypothetical protein